MNSHSKLIFIFVSCLLYSQPSFSSPDKIYRNMMHYALDEVFPNKSIKKFSTTLEQNLRPGDTLFNLLLIKDFSSSATVICKNNSLNKKKIEELALLGKFIALIPYLETLKIIECQLGSWRKEQLTAFFEALSKSYEYSEELLKNKFLISDVIPEFFFKGIEKTKKGKEEALGIIDTILEGVEEMGYPSPITLADLKPAEIVYAGIRGIKEFNISSNHLYLLKEENLKLLLKYISSMQSLETIFLSDNHLDLWKQEDLIKLVETLNTLPHLEKITLVRNNFSQEQKDLIVASLPNKNVQL